MTLACRAGAVRWTRALLLIAVLFTFLPAADMPTWKAQPGLTTRDVVPLQVAADGGPDYAAGELLLKVDTPGALRQSAELARLLDCFGLSNVGEVLDGVYKLESVEAGYFDVEAAAAGLQDIEGVAYVGPNHVFRTLAAPNDEQYVAGQQWGVSQVKAEGAWDITTGAADLIIAVLDTGTATDHPDLSEKIVRGYDALNNDNDPQDDNGHGTYTAGIAAASSNNGTGVTGISWGARIMPVKALGAQGQGTEETIARGMRWAVDNGARIINASLGGDIDSPVMRDAVKYAHDKNVLIVAASGNTPDGKQNFPAAYDTVLAVGATGRSDTHTGFSSYGQYVDVTAPGVGILSTGWDAGKLTYEYGNGTSASAPFVSGVAALVWSVNRALTADQVRWIIEDSSDDLGPPGLDENYGRGRLNAARAVQMARQGPPPARTATPIGQPSVTAQPSGTAAAQPPTSGPALQVDSKQVNPGSLMAITGRGFGPSEIIDLSILSNDGEVRSLGNAQTNSQGAFRAEVALPSRLVAGKAALTAVGAKSKLRATADLTVGQGAGTGGQSVVRGTVRGASGPGVVVRLKPSVGVAGPEQTTQVDPSGAYRFGNLAAGIYALSASTGSQLPAGPFTVQVDGTSNDVKILDITLAGSRPRAFDRVNTVPNGSTLQYFAPVGHTLKGPFFKFWRENGGLPVFGYPLSEEFQEVSPTDGKSYTVQYFERNRFELHPEFAGTRNEVLMGLLGVEMTRGRTFLPGAPFESDTSRVYFKETQHSLSGPFLKYWREKGGLPIFGYPISEEVMENGYLVQYFERNRFEYHPEFRGTQNEVLLGLLGVEVVKRNGWLLP